MAKKLPTVEFKKTDGLKPRATAGAIGLRLPLPLTVKPGAEATIRLGLRCDHALALTAKGTLELLSPAIVPQHQGLVVRVRNPSQTDDLFLELGDTVITAYPLGLVEFDTE